MTSITMADVEAAADEKYGPLVLEDVPGGIVRLLPLIRLSNAKRAEILKLSDTAEKKTPAKKAAARSGSPAKRASSKLPDAASAMDVLAIASKLERMLALSAETDEQGSRLVEHFNGDIGKLEFVFGKWSEQQQAGEPEPSSS